MKILATLLTSLILLIPVHVHAHYQMNAALLTSSKSSVKPPSALEKFRTDLLARVNIERKRRGLKTLTLHAKLNTAAQGHAENMLKKKFFDHHSPEGKTPEDRIRAVGYFTPPCENCSVKFAYAENIGKGATPESIMKAWMGSAVHKKNILKADVQHLGVGYAGGLWVQVFGGIKVNR